MICSAGDETCLDRPGIAYAHDLTFKCNRSSGNTRDYHHCNVAEKRSVINKEMLGGLDQQSAIERRGSI